MDRWMAGLGNHLSIWPFIVGFVLKNWVQSKLLDFSNKIHIPNRLKSLRKIIKVSIIASFSVTNTITITTTTHWRHFVVGLFCFL
jgi:hypothetical protein